MSNTKQKTMAKDLGTGMLMIGLIILGVILAGCLPMIIAIVGGVLAPIVGLILLIMIGIIGIGYLGKLVNYTRSKW